ncbi:MAG: hypothetical protein IJ691_10865 [Lachnospiraceae bacterium]|nr:hypothetical protein [Lachnospiraceae bacterium]
MKIGEAKPIYYANRKELVDQMRSLSKQKEEADKKYKLTGESAFSEQAASLELSLNATKQAFEDNQKVIDSLMEQWANISNMESSKQQGEAMKEMAADMGKIMTVFRRLANGDTVPQSDEKKLMEYDDKMYQMAKNMQMLAQQMEKERKKHKSLWEDEDKEAPEDPTEIADNTEYAGELPDIEIPEVVSDMGGGDVDVSG